MSKTQIVTIIITAVVSVTAKELITWFISVFKNLSAIKTLKGKLKSLFSKPNRVIMTDTFTIVFYSGYLVYFSLRDEPPSRIEILLAFGATFAVIFMIFRLLFHIDKRQIDKEKENTDKKKL